MVVDSKPMLVVVDSKPMLVLVDTVDSCAALTMRLGEESTVGRMDWSPGEEGGMDSMGSVEPDIMVRCSGLAIMDIMGSTMDCSIMES